MYFASIILGIVFLLQWGYLFHGMPRLNQFPGFKKFVLVQIEPLQITIPKNLDNSGIEVCHQ